MNIQIISGNLGRDAITKDTNNGKMVLFSVAVSEKRGESEHTIWFNCVKFFKSDQSTRVADFLKKGQHVTIQGKADIVKKEDKEFHQIIVDRIEFPPRKSVESVPPNAEQPQNHNVENSDDSPF